MARVQRLRCVEACAVLLGASVHVFAQGDARAADSDVAPSAPESLGCPDPDGVWSTVLKLVPSESAQLLAAKPRVEIVDLGERYRVRVATQGGPVQRMYADPVRDCEKRTRFAAEFIVVSLLPPQLGMPPDAMRVPAKPSMGGGPEVGSPSAPTRPEIASPTPALARAPESAATKTKPYTHPLWRIELSAIAEASPPLGAPGLLMWGGGIRIRVGADWLAAIAGVAYLPKSDFGVGDFTGSITRVPAIAGMRAHLVKRAWDFGGDLALSAAFERYEGLSPHTPADATRVTPGIEVGVLASPRARFRLAPIASVRCAWFPLTQELAAAPQGSLGNTPSFWIGAELGISLEL
jgi:hypothetical protein